MADSEQAGIFHLVYSEQAEEVGVGGRAGTQTLLSRVTKQAECMVKSALLRSAAVEGVGLHIIPSYSTSKSTGTRDVAGSRTWSDAVGSSSGAICDSGFGSGSSTAAGSGSWSALGSGIAGGSGWHGDFLITLADDEGGTIVEEYSPHVLLESPLRSVSGQACSGLYVKACPEKYKQAGVIIMDEVL